MAVPKKKTSPSRRNMRRSHMAMKKTNVVENSTTGEYSLPHHVSADGYYNGKQVFTPKNRTAEAAE
jgi:large subunit ribosomal protein L32